MLFEIWFISPAHTNSTAKTVLKDHFLLSFFFFYRTKLGRLTCGTP